MTTQNRTKSKWSNKMKHILNDCAKFDKYSMDTHKMEQILNDQEKWNKSSMAKQNEKKYSMAAETETNT